MKVISRRSAFEVPGYSPLDRLFSSFLETPVVVARTGGSSCGGALAVDLSETEKSVIVRASLPGFSKDEIEVEVADGVLSIRAERESDTQSTQDGNGETYHVRERRFGSVSRQIALPEVALDGEPVAELKDGVLTLTLPKSVRALPKKVKIS
jgi:HSP20 family protein